MIYYHFTNMIILSYDYIKIYTWNHLKTQTWQQNPPTTIIYGANFINI